MKARLASNATQIKSAALAALPDLVRDWLQAGEFRGDVYVALNPLRPDRNLGSFRIDTATGRWCDYSTRDGGSDAVSLLAYLRFDRDYGKALKAIADEPIVRAALAAGCTRLPAKVARAAKQIEASQARVKHVYEAAIPLEGTPADAYLRARGLTPTTGWSGLKTSIQYYPGVGPCPALIAPVKALDGSLSGLHRTYLQPNGQKLDVGDPRRSLGRVRGCAIRLAEATEELIICEGLEDGLTLFQELQVPVWVSGGAANLPNMNIPDFVSTLVIAADNDPPGLRAAWQAADQLCFGRRKVRIMRPDLRFKDFNDEHRGIEA